MNRTAPRILAAAVAALALTQCVPDAAAACKQPAYVIVHRCNDANDGPMAIVNEGANAIEADFSYGWRWLPTDDYEWVVDHDGAYPLSTEVDDWIAQVAAEVHRPGTPLSLIVLDIKDPWGPLMELYTRLRSGLGPDIHLLFSIPDWNQRHEFDQIAAAINADVNAGVAIDFLDEADPEQIQENVQQFFMSKGISRYWFGDGLTAALVTPDSVVNNMLDAIQLRDSFIDCSAFHGAYTWTYETESSFTQFFDMGVNGMFVNSQYCQGYASPATATDPEVAVQIAMAASGRRFATPADDPWQLPVPALACPSDLVLECPGNGGVDHSDPWVAAFLASGVASANPCDAAIVTNDAPVFFATGTSTTVTWTATDSTHCPRTKTCSATLTVQDTTSPAIACPPDIAVDPVSPAGTVVTYSAGATDGCDLLVAATCPMSGATFAVGTETVVTCSATDSSGNSSACSLTVKVHSPQEVVANLQAAVEALSSANPGTRHSLLAHLSSLLGSMADGQDLAACQRLGAFLKKLQQLVAVGALEASEAAPLQQSATNLRNTLDCGASVPGSQAAVPNAASWRSWLAPGASRRH